MASTSKINLIEEFAYNQKGNDYVILTTFNFDAPFFDIYLLSKLFENNPSVEIFILMDELQYNKAYHLFTRNTGRAYHLIPVKANRGVFHPKLSLFTSEEKCTAYIGSSNLTLAGFTSNAEIIVKVESEFEHTNSTVNEAILYFKTLVDKKVVQSSKFIDAISDITKRVKQITQNKDVILLHNLNEPILNQVTNNFDKIEQAVLLAPFWSEMPVVIDKLNKGMKKLSICIQENNHNLTHPDNYQDYCTKKGISLKFFNAKFSEDRLFHSKLMVLDSDKPSLLIGSSNMTEFALLRNADEGNYEVSALIKQDSTEIMDAISLSEVSLENIKNGAIQLDINQFESNSLALSLEFDSISQILHIETKISEGMASLCLINEDKSKEPQEISQGGSIKIKCNKIPFEVELSQNGQSIKRRIFYDDAYFYRKISKGGLSLSEINQKISTDFRINAIDLIRMLNGLNLSVEKELSIETVKARVESAKSESKRFTLPSREIKTYHNRRLLESFADLYRIISLTKRETNEVTEEEAEEGEKDRKVSSFIQRILDEKDERKKICSKILNSVNDLLIYKSYQESNKAEALVASCPLLIQTTIKLLSPIYMDSEILEELRDILNENIDKKSTGLNPDTKKILFFNLVLLNYYFDNNTHYNFLSNLYSIKEVFDKKFLNECVEYINQQLKNIEKEDLFTSEEVLSCIGFLASYIPDSRTVDDDIITSLRIIHQLPDELWDFAEAYLSNLFKMWSLSSSKNEILNETLIFNGERKTFIETLIKDKF